jgi:biotin carboxylase
VLGPLRNTGTSWEPPAAQGTIAFVDVEFSGIKSLEAGPPDQEPADASTEKGESCGLFGGSGSLNDFLRDVSFLITQLPVHSGIIVRIIYSPSGGYLPRSDLVSSRFLSCPDLKFILDLGRSDGVVPAYEPSTLDEEDISKLFLVAIGALAIERSPFMPACDVIATLDKETSDRLTVEMVTKVPFPEQRLVVVQGGFDRTFRRNLYQAAKGLNISIAVLDVDGHWAQTAEDLEHSFVVTDLTRDANLPHRIVASVRSLGLPVHGITTFSDNYLVATAQAASELGLPTGPPESLVRCVNKDRLRHREEAAITLDRASNVQALSASIDYPTIIKPAMGAGSRDVYLCHSADDLLRVATALSLGSESQTRKIISEPYIAGPEVDVNIVLQDGRVIFCEIVDDFPKSGEVAYFPGPRSFLETVSATPSALPQIEQDQLQSDILHELTSRGFSNGVFHVEARVRDSSCAYEVSDTGLMDLQTTGKRLSDIRSASTFLVEINARPPGLPNSLATVQAYGIDFHAMHMLFAVQDHRRIKALSVPCRRSRASWHVAFFVPLNHGGTYRGENAFDALREQRPSLASTICDPLFFLKHGQRVSVIESGRYLFSATGIILSRQSRDHALHLEREVRGFVMEYVDRYTTAQG